MAASCTITCKRAALYGSGEEVHAVQGPGVQYYGAISPFGAFRSGPAHDRLSRVTEQSMPHAAVVIRAPSHPETRLPIVAILTAGGDEAVVLQAAARRCSGILYFCNCATVKCTLFNVVAQSVIQRQVTPNLPGILNVSPIDRISHMDECGANPD